MNFQSLAKNVIPVMIGVVLAGYVMAQFRDVDFFRKASDGFDT